MFYRSAAGYLQTSLVKLVSKSCESLKLLIVGSLKCWCLTGAFMKRTIFGTSRVLTNTAVALLPCTAEAGGRHRRIRWIETQHWTLQLETSVEAEVSRLKQTDCDGDFCIMLIDVSTWARTSRRGLTFWVTQSLNLFSIFVLERFFFSSRYLQCPIQRAPAYNQLWSYTATTHVNTPLGHHLFLYINMIGKQFHEA